MPPPENPNPILPPCPPENFWIDSGWTMLTATHFVHAVYGVVEVEEVPDQFFLDSAKPMPEYPVWLPPREPDFFTQEDEAPHPEVDRIDLPIWLPWRPMPYDDYYSTDEEFVGPWLEPPFYLPPRPYFMPPLGEQPREPIPGNEPYWDVEIPLPPLPQHFMPPHEDFFEPTPHPPKCPPPCLRRPDEKC